jgi:hypothetical protein
MPNSQPLKRSNTPEQEQAQLPRAATRTVTPMQPTVGTIIMSPCGTLIPWPSNSSSSSSNTVARVQEISLVPLEPRDMSRLVFRVTQTS